MSNIFASNLKKIRKDNNISQEQLAEELGVSRQAISKWESSVAYPEMDKIISLCDKFNLNIDDLLHRDIREIKGEEERKNNLNKYIDSFLNFITDTINMFSNMNLKSKIKCLVEQVIIILFLLLVSNIIGGMGNYIISSLFKFLPDDIYNVLFSIFDSIYRVFLLILLVIIMVHVFRTRYLNYYNKLKDNIKDNDNKDISIDGNNKDNEEKIIIRDPKHSEYRFINGVLKLIILGIKIFMFCFSLLLCFGLIMLFCLLIISFLISKTGLLFVGMLGSIISGCVLDIVLILGIFNFVFNRKSDKKKMIWSFILSLILMGISSGLLFTSIIDFEVVNDNNMLKTDTREFDIVDGMFFQTYYGDIKYIESDISNVKLEYKINKYCELGYDDDIQNGIYIWGYCSNPIKMVRVVIDNINHKKIVSIDNEVRDIIVYANHDNIEKLKSNNIKYNDYRNRYESTMDNYEKELNEYREQIDNDNIRIEEYQNKISDLEETIRKLQEENDR